MARSQRLRFGEIRRVQEMIESIKSVGADAQAWRAHALIELSRLVRGQVALTVDLLDAAPGQALRAVAPIDVGWTDQGVRIRYGEYYASGESADDPGAQALLEGHERARFSTFFRRRRIEDREWYGAPSVSEARRYGEVDDFVCSTVALRPGVLQGFMVYRALGDRPFEEHERRLMRLFHAQIIRAISWGNEQDMPGLSPRLRETMTELLSGKPMKEIAGTMGISAHTVNDYMKALYKRLGVNSRAELAARWSRRRKLRVLQLPAALASAVR